MLFEDFNFFHELEEETIDFSCLPEYPENLEKVFLELFEMRLMFALKLDYPLPEAIRKPSMQRVMRYFLDEGDGDISGLFESMEEVIGILQRYGKKEIKNRIRSAGKTIYDRNEPKKFLKLSQKRIVYQWVLGELDIKEIRDCYTDISQMVKSQ